MLLYSWAEEHHSSSSMFKYWMLTMKFQINYLVFIRSMKEENFKFFDKILISLVNHFSFPISAIMLDGYWCTFKICWASPSHALNSIENVMEESLWSRFQVVSFHESIMKSLTIRQLNMDWIVQVTSYRAGGGNCRTQNWGKVKASR